MRKLSNKEKEELEIKFVSLSLGDCLHVNVTVI